MKKIIFILVLLGFGMFAKAQTPTNPFPSLDSLEKFINRYIRNSAVEAFQNLRMNTALIGMSRFIRNGSIGSGVDTMYKLNDSTVRLITHAPDTFDVTLRFAGSGGGPNSSVGSGFRWVVWGTQNIKSATAGFGQLIDSATANELRFRVDTFGIETRDRGIKTIDSLHGIIQVDLDGKQPTGNYITALTGDVAATGPGSVAATIQPNAVTTGKIADNNVTTAKIADNNVTNGKFRQSVANSLVGRAGNTTGNVDDIQATVTGTHPFFNGTNIIWDSADYAKLKNVPPTPTGMYVAPAQSFNQGFLVKATAIVYPTNAYSAAATIAWGILDQASGHNSSFIDSVYGNSSTNQLMMRYPNVKHVLVMNISPDETFANNAVFAAGPSVGFTLATVDVKRNKAIGIKLRGDGSTTWVKQSDGSQYSSSFTLSTYSTANGSTSFNVATAINNYAIDYSSMQLQYIGQNGYRLIRKYSGLGADNIGFILTDQFNNPVLTAPTSTDEVVITNAGMATEIVNMRTYGSSNTFMGTFTNFWVSAWFEAWMVAAPLSSTSIQVRYQTDYPSATSYKIYRGTHLYNINTLVHTGTTGLFIDAGLTANTIYYYKMVAVVSGVDTDVTTFRTNTNF